MPQHQANVVPTIEQAVLAKGIDLERKSQLAVGGTHQLRRQINDQLVQLRQLLQAPARRTGSTPFLKQLLKKMSAKLGAMMALNP